MSRHPVADWTTLFWKGVRKTRGCWLWKKPAPNGYGVFGINRKDLKFRTSAHRISYELAYGTIPVGYTVDHKCRNLACVRPSHLEAVPHLVNLLRGNTVNARNAAKTHCDHGHKFTKENTYIRYGKKHKNGARVCRTCARSATRKYELKRR